MTAPRRGRKKARATSRAEHADDRPAAKFDVVRDILDHELLDADGVPCGVVDDVMLDGEPGAPLRVVALIVGPGGWLPRLPSLVGGLLRHVVAAKHVRVPWSAVAHVGERIELAQRASELGLGVADRRIGRVLARIPGASHAPE
jgi:sporulation protein YlmC with PRC-barrel domain